VTLEDLLIERACTELLMRYGRAQDEMRGDLMEGLFSADAVMNLIDGPRIEGREAIERFWNGFFARPRPSIGRHIFTNLRTEITGEAHARGSAYVAVHRYTPGKPVTTLAPVMIGEARLEYVRTAEGWRMSLYELEVTTLDGYVHGVG
jgi:hypothetical protein